MNHKVAQLTGALLDMAVARAQWRGLVLELRGEPARCFVDGVLFQPSTDWSHGGPIIEYECLDIAFQGPDWAAGEDLAQWKIDCGAALRGSTALEAAMRAYVAERYGAEIELD